MNEYGVGHYQPKKNSQIHLRMETSLFLNLKKQIEGKYLSLSELCRQKLRKDRQLDRIELLLKKLINK